MSTTEAKTGRTGRPICPRTGKEIYEPWSGYVPEDGIVPGQQRPEGVPEYSNYWEEPAQAGSPEAGVALPRQCECGKTFEGSTDEIEKKMRGHKLHCGRRKAKKE